MCREEAELFKVLGVESRLKILDLLKRKGSCCVNEIADVLRITPSAVSQHLKLLRHAGFVRSERKGYWIPYEVDPDALEECGRLLSEVCTCGCLGPGSGERGRGHSLDELRAYEQKLQDELQRVRERIETLAEKGGT